MVNTKEEILDEIKVLDDELKEIKEFESEIKAKEGELEELKKEQETTLSVELEKEIAALNTVLTKMKIKMPTLEKDFIEDNRTKVSIISRKINDYKNFHAKRTPEIIELISNLKEATKDVVHLTYSIEKLYKQNKADLGIDFNLSGLLEISKVTQQSVASPHYPLISVDMDQLEGISKVINKL